MSGDAPTEGRHGRPEGRHRPADGGGHFLGHAASIARVEVRRSVRSLGRETNKLVGIAISGLLLVAMTLAAAGALLTFGGDALGFFADNPGAARAAFAGLWLFVAGITTFRTVSIIGEIDAAPGMLTTTSPRAVLGGLLLAEAARHALYLALPLLLLAVAFSVGTGVALAGPALMVAALLAWASAFPVGYLAGQAIRYATRAVPFVRRNRLSLGALAMVAYMGVIVQFGDLVLVLSDTPLGWYADVLLSLATGGGSTPRALATLGVAALGAPATLLAIERAAMANWYGDPPAETDDGEDASGTAVGRAGRRLERFVARPTAAVARAVWLRARRSPFKLAYAIVPAFAFVGYLAPAVREGTLPDTMPVMLAGYAAWSVGAAFTLNPIGDEGALLPVTVSSGISGTRFVRGRMLAAWLPGVVPTAALVAVAALAVGDPPVTVGLAVAYAAALALAAPAFAVGIGVAIPNFDTQRVMLTREAVTPSVVAFFGFLFVLGVVALPGAVALLLEVEPLAWQAGGVLATALLGALAGVPGYVYAVRAFEGYEIDR